MNPICNDCGKQKKLIPAGTSKRTGKPYKAFYVCEVCPKPQKPLNSPDSANFNAPEASNKKFDELMSALGELSVQITDLSFKVDDVYRKLDK